MWEPLPTCCGMALLRANVVLVQDTANHVAEQDVQRGRIRVLPWALDPGLRRSSITRRRESCRTGIVRARITTRMLAGERTVQGWTL